MTYTYKLARRIALLRDRALVSSLALAAACGGSDLTETDPGSPSSQAPSAPVVVIPQVITIETNQTVSFAAREGSRRAVAGTVEWAASGGRISHDGAFTSSQPGTFMLVGRIQGERAQFPRAGTARVRVVPAQTNLASIRVAPENVRLAPGAQQAFEVSGYLPNQGIYGTFGVPVGVTWIASGGRIDASGVYTAGDAAGTFRVAAKSVGTGMADTVLVIIDPSLTPPAEPAPDSTPDPTPDPTPDSTPTPPATLAGVVLTPSTAALQTGATQQFAATGVMSDGSPASVTFSYSATGGSITPQGLYQAGASAGTYAVIATAAGGAVADTAELTITVPVATSPPAAGSCLAGASGSLVTLAGTQTAAYDTRSSPLPSGVRVSAKTAVWNGVANYLINFASGAGGCWSGGTATGKWNQETTPWDTYHGSFGLHVYAPNVVVEHLRIHNYGDGVRFTARGVTGWTLRSSYFSDIHDDCMEDDLLTSGVIEDNLFDGCYMGISMRPAIKDLATVDGRNETVVMKNNLLRIKPFALTNKAPNTSGGFMKTENREPAKNVKLIMVGNIFRADGLPGVGSLCLNQHNMVKQSSGNILVWLGAGSFPCALPPGWTMTRDVKVWDNAVVAWKASHL